LLLRSSNEPGERVNFLYSRDYLQTGDLKVLPVILTMKVLWAILEALGDLAAAVDVYAVVC
jgi:uncharacterized membrane protein